MELNVVKGDLKVQKTYSVSVKLTMTDEEMRDPASYQLTKKQIFELFMATEEVPETSQEG